MSARGKTVDMRRRVLEALQQGPATNRQVRTRIFGAGQEDKCDVAGYETTAMLRALVREGKVELTGHPRRWALVL